MLSAILGERNTVNVLHHEPRGPIIRCVCVIESCDQWMSQLSEGPLFAGKAFAAGRGKPGITQDLDRDLSAKVITLRKINDSHSAFTQQFQDSIGTELFKNQRRGKAFRERLSCNIGYIAIEQRVLAGVLIQHGQNLYDEFHVVAACRLQERSLLGLGQVCRIVKQTLDLVQTRTIHSSVLPTRLGSAGLPSPTKRPPQPSLGRSPVAQDRGL